MPKYNKQDLKTKAENLFGEDSINFATKRLIMESKDFKGPYDIFLSHSFLDSDIILVIKKDFEKKGYSVYVDWVDDPQLSRTNVTKETAELIRTRLKNCKSLIYAYSENSKISKWMPWELGFFDGYKSKVAVLPIEDDSISADFEGIEFVGIYPFITKTEVASILTYFWINNDQGEIFKFEKWIRNYPPLIIKF